MTIITNWKTGGVAAGLYRVVSVEHPAGAFPQSIKVNVADSTGNAWLTCAEPTLNCCGVPEPGRVIHGTIWPRVLNGFYGGTLQSWHYPAAKDITNQAALIPHSQCPEKARQSLSWLVGTIPRLTCSGVSSLVNTVIEEHHAAMVRLPAASGLDHDYPGGWLTYSVATAGRCHDAFLALNGQIFPPTQVLWTAGFLHGLGQLGMGRFGNLTEDVRPPWPMLTLTMLGPHLKTFRGAWPDGAALLEAILCWLASDEHQRNQRFREGELVRSACLRARMGWPGRRQSLRITGKQGDGQ